MKGKQRTLSVLLFIMMLCISTLTLSSDVQAAGTYNASAALSYAKSHWSDGKGLCAEFVSDCLKAGGSSAYSARATVLFNQLKASGTGTMYEIALGSGQSIYMPNYAGKIAAGDPVFYYCPKCDDGKAYMIHTVLCNGSDANGYMKAYSHNNPNSGSSKYTYASNCYDCGRRITTAYVYHFGESDQVPIAAVDVVEGGEGTIHVRGWAFDPDVPSQQLEIHVYVGGDSASPNAVGYRIKANKERPDVNNIYECGNYHGFDEVISVSKSGTQEIYIYAINANSNNHPVIGKEAITIKKQNIIEFSSDPITLNEGEKKSITISFQGDGIYTFGEMYDSNYVAVEWLGIDWNACTATVRLEGKKAGNTDFVVAFLDSDYTEYFRDSVSVQVNHVHKYTQPTCLKNATCTTTGVKSYVCSCGAVSSTRETIPAIGHSGGTATCTTKKKCDRCGEYYGSLLAHAYSSAWTIDKAATCTTTGSKSHHCTKCNAKSSITTIPATGHSGGKATCTVLAKCSKCAKSYGNLKAHSYSSAWTIDKATTCTTTGSKSHHCLNCGAKKDITTISATGHSGGTATCTSLAKCYKCGIGYGSLREHSYDNGTCIKCGRNENLSDNGSDSNVDDDFDKEDQTSDNNNQDINDNDDNTLDDNLEDGVEELEVGSRFQIDGISYQIIKMTRTKKYVAVIEINNKKESSVSLPNNIQYNDITFGVTEIGNYAFANIKNLKKVTIGSNVTKIGKKAFYNCKKLSKIKIKSKKLKKIGKAAFKNISRKAIIDVPNSKIKKYKTLFRGKGNFRAIR